MPGDTLKKAIQRGTGELPGVTYEEFSLEGYGPGGTALLLEITSDNRNRTVAEIRSLLTKNHGNMAEAGAVAWQFQKKGLVTIEKGKVDEDTLLSLALDAGAEDVKVGAKSFEIITSPHDFEAVKKALVDAKIETTLAEITYISQNTVGRNTPLVFISGPPGTGKSHLAAAALRDWIEHHGRGGLFIRDFEMMVELRNSNEEARELSRISTTPALVIDDLGTENLSEYTTSIYYSILSARDHKNLPTILTSNFNLDKLAARWTTDDDPTSSQRVVRRIADTGLWIELSGVFRKDATTNG